MTKDLDAMTKHELAVYLTDLTDWEGVKPGLRDKVVADWTRESRPFLLEQAAHLPGILARIKEEAAARRA